MRRAPWLQLAAILSLLMPGAAQAEPTVADLTPTDVTPKAFSWVWSSDEAVTSASLGVFDDADGTIDRTGDFTQVLVSPPALALGLVKVDVQGVPPATCFYVQAATESNTGTTFTPPAPPYREVCTQAQVRREDAFGKPITNDVLRHEVAGPDGVTPATGALVVLEVPDVGSPGVSAFVGDGFGPDQAVLPLNDVFAAATQETTPLAPDTPLRLREFRGSLCPDPADPARVRYRRVPSHEEVGAVGAPISQVEPPATCFFADSDCNGTVEVADADRVLAGIDTSLGDCRFNPDLDTVADQEIDVLDLQRVLNHLGEAAP